MKILYDRYKAEGLEILAFPCNNFASQEPGTNDEIQEFARQKGAEYPVLGKLQCDAGADTHPIYKYLMGSLSSNAGPGLTWNFAKFLCNADGVPIKRYLPDCNPLSIEEDIKEVLAGTKIVSSVWLSLSYTFLEFLFIQLEANDGNHHKLGFGLFDMLYGYGEGVD